jgi:hypothetical protein
VFSQRARDSELLDLPDGHGPSVEKSYRFMRLVNRIGGGTRVVRRFLARELAARRVSGGVMRVLDLGAGTCDIPLAVTGWAARRGLRVEFTCLDHNTQALDMARQAITRAGCSTIKLVQGDLFTYQPAEGYDCAVGSMVFHHLTDSQILSLLDHLRSFVGQAVLINDLERSALNYAVSSLLTLGRDPVLRRDALLSVRRGFTRRDLSAILTASGTDFTVTTAWFCRVVAVIRFPGRVTP